MSYDISIGKEHFNQTFNLAPMFYGNIRDTGKGGGLRELDGLTGKQAIPVLDDALQSLSDKRLGLWKERDVGDTDFRALYDAPNGWGSTIGGILFLGRLLAACAQNRRKVIRVNA